MNEQKLKTLAKDLRKEEPRHVSKRLAGFDGAARCLDKCRATLLGWNGEFQYGCPMDQMFFNEREMLALVGAYKTQMMASWESRRHLTPRAQRDARIQRRPGRRSRASAISACSALNVFEDPH